MPIKPGTGNSGPGPGSRRPRRLLASSRAAPRARRRPVVARVAFFILQFSFSVTLSTASAAAPRELLDEAVREYRSALDTTGREQRLATFRRAELLFERLTAGAAAGDSAAASPAIQNADLYVNLGNAALGAERLGTAILAYRRALLLDPDHRRARSNLAHARALLPDWLPRPEESGWFDTFFAWSRRLSPGELRILSAAAFLAASGLLASSIRWRLPSLRNLAAVPAGVWLLLVGLMFFGPGAGSDKPAVVVVPEIVARTADSTGAPARLPQPLPGGTELDVMETRDPWARVRLFDGRDAWLPSSSFEFVRLPSARTGSAYTRL